MALDVLFHVGPHKTGTTTLQYAFHALRGVFASAGVYYPKGLHESGAHHALAWQLLGRPLDFLGLSQADVKEPKTRLRNWLDEATSTGCETILLSAEDFSLLSLEQWTTVTDVLHNSPEVGTIGLLHTTRCVTEMARSAYGTLVMFGENRTFKELEAILIRRFELVLAKLESLCGHDGPFDKRVELKFDHLVQQPELVQSFCRQALGIKLPKLEWPKLNTSLPNDIIEEVRLWNTRNSPGITIEAATGDFPVEVFDTNPSINSDRVEFLRGLLAESLPQ